VLLIRRQPVFNSVAAVVLALALQGFAASIAHAQHPDNYPTKPIRMIVPFAPGGPPDVIGRPLSLKLSEALGQPVVFDNRPGAAGMIGTEIVAKSPRDGYTMLYTTGSHNTNSLMYRKLPYDAHKDFVPITQISRSYGQIMIVHPSLPVTTARDLVALARLQPGKLHFGSAGVGNATHLAAELLISVAGIKLAHVPYKGAGPAFTDLLGGHIEIMFPSISQVAPQILSGRVRAIALAGPIRAPLLPNVPTFIEAGYPGVDFPGWQAMWFPAGTPRDRVDRIQQEVAKILRTPESKLRFDEAGLVPVGSTPEEFAAFIEKDLAFFAKVIRDAKIDPQ
jgi:tripartite-type tricarboxylate transporter receptor subunit TctC